LIYHFFIFFKNYELIRYFRHFHL